MRLLTWPNCDGVVRWLVSALCSYAGRTRATHEPDGSPTVDPLVRVARRAGEGHVTVPGSVKRCGNEETRETPVVAGAVEAKESASERRDSRVIEAAHFLKTLKKGMVAEEKR